MSEIPRAALPDGMPERIARLPVRRGYPVPWFVAWLDGDTEMHAGQGSPDFRVVGAGRIAEAHRFKLCWICGQPRGAHMAFVVGPMCAVNRVSSEPPSHVDCAEWSARACPFLARPHMVRREGGMPVEATPPPGIGLKRNPGVALVWVTRRYSLRRVPNGVLFIMGDPERVSWYAEGREATRAEIQSSIDSGLPTLAEMAESQGPLAVHALHRQVSAAMELLPA